MDLIQYSTALSVAVLALFGTNLVAVAAWIFLKEFRSWVAKQDYFLLIKIIGLLAILSTAGALIYQEIYRTPVCILCWWQRIFMFPIDIIAIIALLQKNRGVHAMIAALAVLGAGIAGYHYYYHVIGLVLKLPVDLSCAAFGLLPACTESPILIFGFVTIPLMALLVFLAILTLTFFASRAARE